MKPTKERLIDAAAELFAEHGFEGTSVRAVCRKAQTSANMIHHFFGNKEGLRTALLQRFSTEVFLTPLRIIEDDPKTAEELAIRFELFLSETMEALINHRRIFILIVRESTFLAVFQDYSLRFEAFLDAAKRRGLACKTLESGMLSGLVLDRVGNQILYASAIEKMIGKTVLSDAGYKKRWIKANVDLILNGVMSRD